MHALQLYYQRCQEVDQLQKSIQNNVRDQLQFTHDLLEKQDHMKRLASIIMTEGDRPLLGTEIVSLQPSNHGHR